MSRLYSVEDVARWQDVDVKSLRIHQVKLATDLPQAKIDFHLGGLAGSYYMQGMTLIAKGNFDEAIESFRASAEARCKMYERFEKGLGRLLEAGHFQSILVTFVTKDPTLISRLVAHYRAEEGTPDSIFLGVAIKLLATGAVDAAKLALAQRKPRFEAQFVGYADCLEAIANRDRQRFKSALQVGCESWAKWASKKVKGLPDSVCFIQGVGLVRLAECVFGNPIHFANEYMPKELLQ